MQRREFIKLIGGAAATWPLSARAQPASKIFRIGFVGPHAADSLPENSPKHFAPACVILAMRRGATLSSSSGGPTDIMNGFPPYSRS